MTDVTPMAAILSTARRQYGVFSADQAAAAGLPKSNVSYHSRPGGGWRRIAPGVYALNEGEPDWREQLMAAQLWGGDDAVLSHRSAAAILGLDGRPAGSAPVELTCERSHPPATWTVHHQTVDAGHLATTDGLRHTDGLQTLLDLAAVVDTTVLERVLESVLRFGYTNEGAVRHAAQQSQARGIARLREVLALRTEGVPATASELETRFLQVIRASDAPPCQRQWPVRTPEGRVVAYLDLAWPEAALFVELDGKAWHTEPQAQQHDRRRQNEVVARLGWRPLRYTWEDVVRRPRTTARQVAVAYHQHLSALLGGVPEPARR